MIRSLSTKPSGHRWWLTSSVLLVCALVSACNGSGGAAGLWDVPEVSRQIIRRWLYCIDCTDGELASVTAKGATMVPYLSTAILDGAPPLDDSLAERRAIEAVNRVIRYRARRGGTMSVDDSSNAVERQHDSFLLTYRLRAAQALRTIDPLRAATDVAQLCQQNPPEMQRQPAFRASFKSIGACP